MRRASGRERSSRWRSTAAIREPAYEFTSQLFFEETFLDAVHAKDPYAARGRRETLNAEDGIFQEGGRQLLLDVARTDRGYAASFDLAMDSKPL